MCSVWENFEMSSGRVKCMKYKYHKVYSVMCDNSYNIRQLKTPVLATRVPLLLGGCYGKWKHSLAKIHTMNCSLCCVWCRYTNAGWPRYTRWPQRVIPIAHCCVCCHSLHQLSLHCIRIRYWCFHLCMTKIALGNPYVTNSRVCYVLNVLLTHTSLSDPCLPNRNTMSRLSFTFTFTKLMFPNVVKEPVSTKISHFQPASKSGAEFYILL